MISGESVINKELYTAFNEWEEKCRFDTIAKDNNLSRPFVCSVSDRYVSASKRIMIVGQETNNFPLYTENWLEEEIQEWGVKYLEKQLWNIGNEKYNRSAFWKLFRYIDSSIGYCPCWNNVDKAQRIINDNAVSLTIELEEKLNSVKLSNGNTILQEEIWITKPNAVLFITGPDYWFSMATALNLDRDSLSSLKPSINKLCSDISDLSNLDIPVIWTYHPTFLNRNEGSKGYFSNVVKYLSDRLNIKKSE